MLYSFTFLWYSMNMLNAGEQQPEETDTEYGHRSIKIMLELIDDMDSPYIFKAYAHTALSVCCREGSLSFKHLEVAKQYVEMAKEKNVEAEFPGLLEGLKGMESAAWVELYGRTKADDPEFREEVEKMAKETVDG